MAAIALVPRAADGLGVRAIDAEHATPKNDVRRPQRSGQQARPSRGSRTVGLTAWAIGCVFAVSVSLVLAFSQPLHAAEDDATGSFLNPFPEGDVYQVTVLGDGFAYGLHEGLIEALGTDPRLSIRREVLPAPTIMTSNFDNKVTDLDRDLNADPVNIAIVMIGESDRVALRSSTGRRVPAGSPEWLAEYARRVDVLMKTVKRRNAGVYWVGLPILARGDANEQAQRMNDVLRERAYLNGFKYIDAYAGFSDEAGGYSAYGPDLQGKIRVLRQGDGVSFTGAGNRKLAHFVEKDLRRDLNQARANRTIPLLGSEDEQVKVNPDNAVKTPSPSSPAAAGGPPPPTVKATANDGSVSGTTPSPTGDQKADNGKITLTVAGAGGRDEKQTIEIVRPAIPASVVALMSRREGSSQLGDLMVEQISGGLTLMSSITPSGNRVRGKLSPTQAPYFRLLVKGERLVPKPGRADDTSWQRPDTSSNTNRIKTSPSG